MWIDMREEIKKRVDQVRAGKIPDGYHYHRGIGIAPIEWKVGQLSNIIKNVQRPVPKPDSPYWRLGIRSHAKGTFHEFVENPDAVAMDELYLVEANDLIVNITFAWEHAIALAGIDDAGKLVSHRFPTYVFKNGNAPKYFEGIVVQHKFKEMLVNISPGGAGRNRVLNKTDFLKLPCYIPSTKEQEKIAEILNYCDNVIELKQQLIAEECKRKKWLMQKLLMRKNHYRKTTIGALTEVYSGATPQTSIPEYWDGAIRWMSSGELNLKRVYDVEGRITEQGLSNSGTKLLPQHCVLIGLAGQGKTRGTVAINYVPLCTNQSIAAVLPNEKFIPEYLYWNLENRYLELRKISSGDGARGGLNLELIKGVVVYLPPLVEQKKVANTLTSIESKIDLLEQELAQWQQKKKALMQLLLTGLVRVDA